MQAMEWEMSPQGHLRLSMVPMMVMCSIALVVVTPGSWLFGSIWEAIVWTLMPLTGIGVGVSIITSKIVVDPVGVRQVSLPVVRTIPWESIEAVEIVPSGLARMPVAGLRVKGRRRPIKLWQTGRMSPAGKRERDVFIAEMRRQFSMHHESP